MTGFARPGLLADRIAQVCTSLPGSVKLVAVTKQVPVSLMRQAYAAGIRDFGESRVQEAAAKQAELQDLSGVTWHLIGHLQGNKAQQALQSFQWIQSVDSLKLAQRLNRLAADLSVEPRVCLQVKLLPDPNKYGWAESELLADLVQLSQCKYLKIQGLMTIPPLGLHPTETLAVFEQTRQLAQQICQLNLPNVSMKELSMGMSGDYKLAIQAKTTMVRLGQVLFGDRPVVQ